MTMATMAGAIGGGYRVQLNGSYSVTSSVPSPTTATAQFELTNAGAIRLTNPNNTVNTVGSWVVPAGNFSAYEAMLTVNSGSTPSGAATATWLNLGTTRNWQLVRNTLGLLSSNCTLQIRNASTLAVLATSTLTWTAEQS